MSGMDPVNEKSVSSAAKTSDASAISLKDLVFQYPKANVPTIVIPDWQLTRGQNLFLSGRSGSGKSTLLNLICGILTPTSGEVRILDNPFSTFKSAKRDRFRARHIGVVFQQLNLIPYLTVLQNIALASYFAKTTKSPLEPTLRTSMESLRLPSSILHQRACELSVGQQQRVAILRAMVNHPEILIADEPTSALDSDARQGFIDLLLAATQRSNTTLVFVSHDLGLHHHFDQHVSIETLNEVPLNAV